MSASNQQGAGKLFRAGAFVLRAAWGSRGVCQHASDVVEAATGAPLSVHALALVLPDNLHVWILFLRVLPLVLAALVAL